MEVPKTLIIIGFSMVLLGVVAWAAQRIPWVYSWFGHLPGDIRVEGDLCVCPDRFDGGCKCRSQSDWLGCAATYGAVGLR